MADDRHDPGRSEHAHRWAYGDVRLVDNRPMLIQRCACGAERRIRAFERSWEPPEPDSDP